MNELDLRLHHEQLNHQVREGPRPGRAEGDLARMAFGVGDELLQRIDRKGRMDRQHRVNARDESEQAEISAPIEWKLRCHERHRREHGAAVDPDGVSIGRALCDRIDAR